MASSADERTNDVWVLDTETKGTGANMVPLGRILKRESERAPGFRLPGRRPPPPAAPEARRPHRFRIVDVMTRQVLADDADARAAIRVLEDVRSIVDISIYAWDASAQHWVRLSFGETRSLWNLRKTASDY